MMKVPQSVRREAFKKYILKCKDKYNIAFFQWRYRFPSKVKFDKRLLEQVILDRLNKMIEDDINQDQKISKETLAGSKCTRDFLKKYDLAGKEQPHLVNNFWAIGWDDPFPDDDKMLIGSLDDPDKDLNTACHVEDWVYPELRYMEGCAPF